jgi:hypothetical protein
MLADIPTLLATSSSLVDAVTSNIASTSNDNENRSEEVNTTSNAAPHSAKEEQRNMNRRQLEASLLEGVDRYEK